MTEDKTQALGAIIDRVKNATTPMPVVTHASGLAHSEQLGELAAALSAAQAVIVGAKKETVNPFYKAAYADLASVWEACRKPLTDNGLAVSQWPVPMERGIGVVTVLLHRSGQWMAAPSFAAPKDMGAQAIGSVITYLRRYALAACAGIPQIDDDGNAAEGKDKFTHAPAAAQGEPPEMGPEEPGSHDGPTGDGVYVTDFKRAESKPGAPKPWVCAFVKFSNGTEGAAWDAASQGLLQMASVNKQRVLVSMEPSRKDPSKNTITAASLADSTIF